MFGLPGGFSPVSVPLRDRPVAVFDSGIGGLTVLNAIRRLLPGEHLIYGGDTARVPYGNKSPATVTRFTIEVVRALLREPVKMVVIGCNTASSVALGALTDAVDPTGAVPVIGVIGPGAHAALAHSPRRRIAVIGTERTIQGGAYQRVLKALDPSTEVMGRACPLFVPLAEEGWLTGEITRLTVERYLADVRAWEPESLILGCTHYPLLRGVIGEVMGEGVNLIDSSDATAREVKALMEARGLLRGGNDGTSRFFVTDGPERFQTVGERFLGGVMGPVELLRLEGT